MQVLLNNKEAYKINAKYKGIKTEKSALYNCDGTDIWIPFSVSRYNAAEKTILIYEWYYNKKIKYNGVPYWKHA